MKIVVKTIKSGPIYVHVYIAKNRKQQFCPQKLVLESITASQLMIAFLTEKIVLKVLSQRVQNKKKKTNNINFAVVLLM